MAFIDEITFNARAGRGGDGVVRWRHEKGKEYAGPAGGNGGKGGDILVRAVHDINILAGYKAVKSFRAGNGEAGMNLSRQGSEGADYMIDLPIGSTIVNLETGRTVELEREGQVEKILHGGRGGLGNEYFKASTNTKPMESTPGEAGEAADFKVELSLIADVGLIGLPNAGKSSLLNALTRARAKVGSYAFTTLDPNLGALPDGSIVADIPGLIEGASEGRGLGDKFLRHVRRTEILVHLVSLEEPPEVIAENYATVRRELEKYGQGLIDKDELIVLTKTDVSDDKGISEARKMLAEKSGIPEHDIATVSVLDDESVKRLSEKMMHRVRKFGTK